MSQYHLQGANIHGGDFRTINFYQNQGNGIQALIQAVSHGAMHDSDDRDPPELHPGTREKAIKDIVSWIEGSHASSTVLWVNGRAGVGKSALMQMIAELEGIYFGGSFFFRRSEPGCNTRKHLFTTLAYQLTVKVPGMREYVDRAMIDDAFLPMKPGAVQLKRLIVEPIRLLQIAHPIIIIIDGLDECDGIDSQRKILTVIGKVATDPNAVVRFIIASRPEHQICEMFNEEPLFSKTRRLVLDEEYDSLGDIKRYLQEKFEEIYSRNRDFMPGVRSPWPSENDLQTLVWRASGQFIYAATVIRFIGSCTDLHTPEERLKIILHPSPFQASAFSELDRLYTQILSSDPLDTKVLVHILEVVLALEAACNTVGDSKVNSIAVIAAITGYGEAKVLSVLRALQSVMKIQTLPIFDDADDVEPNGTNVHLVKHCHQSFHDFLTDKSRSGSYFIDEANFRIQILCWILELATTSIKELRICESFSSLSIPIKDPNMWHQFGVIFCQASLRRSENCSKFKEAIYPVLNNLKAIIFNVHPLQLSQSVLSVFIHILEFLCTALLSVIQRAWYFNLETDPRLEVRQFLVDTRNLIDECYRRSLASSVVGPSSLLMHLALDLQSYNRSLREIGDICNIQDRQLLRRAIEENHLIHIHYKHDNPSGHVFKLVRVYSTSSWLQFFFLDANRCRTFYSASWIIDKCQQAINITEIVASHDKGSIMKFFTPSDLNPIAHATHLLESVRNGSDRNEFLGFLGYLSEICWLGSPSEIPMTLGIRIVKWAYTALESSSLEPGDIRDAVHKVLIETLRRGILPDLDQHISRSNNLGLFKVPICIKCVEGSSFLYGGHWGRWSTEWTVLSRTLHLCTDQDFFHALCTRLAESCLLELLDQIYSTYGPPGDYDQECQHICELGDNTLHTEGYDYETYPFDSFSFSSLCKSSYPDRSHWSIAFTHASRSSKCILFGLHCLHKFSDWPDHRMAVEYIVWEMVDWLKTQTVDPRPQDVVISWIENANKKIDRAFRTGRGARSRR